MPAVRVTDAVSPLCSHVTEATSRQHVHGCMCERGRETGSERERVRGCLYCYTLRGQVNVCDVGFLEDAGLDEIKGRN